MRQFIVEIIIFTILSMICFSIYGDDWRDEEHVWNEEKKEWVIVKNKKACGAPE